MKDPINSKVRAIKTHEFEIKLAAERFVRDLTRDEVSLLKRYLQTHDSKYRFIEHKRLGKFLEALIDVRNVTISHRNGRVKEEDWIITIECGYLKPRFIRVGVPASVIALKEAKGAWFKDMECRLAERKETLKGAEISEMRILMKKHRKSAEAFLKKVQGAS